MENLYIESTLNTPSIKIDVFEKTFEITGVSLPENAFDFYDSLMNHIDNINLNEFDLIFDLQYSNSSSTKNILLLIKKCVDLYKDVNIIWKYEDDDDNIKEMGEDLQDAIKQSFNFIVKQ